MNRPTKRYNYNRAGVAMLTLKTRPGTRLCCITQETFALTETGRVVQQALIGIPLFYEQIKVGQYQIMPDHLHVMVHVVRDLPPGVTLQRVIRGFKLGVNRDCKEATGAASVRVFEKGMYDSLVFSREHLEREVAYMLFDLCCEGRLLEVSVAGAFPRYARLDRAACLRLNEVTEELATTQWSQTGG